MQGFLKRLMEAPDVSRLRRRVEQDPTPKSSIELCRRLQRQGRSTLAMEQAREALKRFPNSRELQDILRATWRLTCRDRMDELQSVVAEAPSPEHFAELFRRYVDDIRQFVWRRSR